ncbi:MAG: hypothetical protein SGCHY_005039, partial [Lobulomycetales sp.]
NWLTGGRDSACEAAVADATDETQPFAAEALLASWLELADKIKAKTLSGTGIVKALARRLAHQNPNVAIMTVKLTDTLIKNCGHAFLLLVAEKDFVDALVNLQETTPNHQLSSTILEHVQAWAIAFRGKYQLAYVEAVYNQLKRDGKPFPKSESALMGASAMIDTLVVSTLPRQIDFCRLQNGQTVTKSITLPHLGINDREVRVCDGCYDQSIAGTIGKAASARSSSFNLAGGAGTSTQEDLDLKRALEASLRDSGPPPANRSSPRHVRVDSDPDLDDEQLNAAIQASLREAAAASERRNHAAPALVQPVAPVSQEISNGDLDNLDLFSTIVERMEHQQQQQQQPGGPSILYNTEIQQMYANMVGTVAPRLQTSIRDVAANLETWRVLDDKMTNGSRGYDRLVLSRIQGAGGGVPMHSQQYQGYPAQHYEQSGPNVAGNPQHYDHQFNQQPHAPLPTAAYSHYSGPEQNLSGDMQSAAAGPLQFYPPNQQPVEFAGQPQSVASNQGYPASYAGAPSTYPLLDEQQNLAQQQHPPHQQTLDQQQQQPYPAHQQTLDQQQHPYPAHQQPLDQQQQQQAYPPQQQNLAQQQPHPPNQQNMAHQQQQPYPPHLQQPAGFGQAPPQAQGFNPAYGAAAVDEKPLIDL